MRSDVISQRASFPSFPPPTCRGPAVGPTRLQKRGEAIGAAASTIYPPGEARHTNSMCSLGGLLACLLTRRRPHKSVLCSLARFKSDKAVRLTVGYPQHGRPAPATPGREHHHKRVCVRGRFVGGDVGLVGRSLGRRVREQARQLMRLLHGGHRRRRNAVQCSAVQRNALHHRPHPDEGEAHIHTTRQDAHARSLALGPLFLSNTTTTTPFWTTDGGQHCYEHKQYHSSKGQRGPAVIRDIPCACSPSFRLPRALLSSLSLALLSALRLARTHPFTLPSAPT